MWTNVDKCGQTWTILDKRGQTWTDVDRCGQGQMWTNSAIIQPAHSRAY